MKNFVITIARGLGSGGKYIGTLLSKELGIPCYDNQLPKMLEEYSGINKALFASRDEKLSAPYLIKKLSGFPTEYVASPMDKDFVSDNNLYNIQSELIQELARTESCIIIGKCANYVLRNRKNVMSVYIEAPRAYCLDNTMELFGLSIAEANKLIEQTDKYRADYYRYYTNGKSWTDPVAYDMTLNTGRIEKENCAKIILSYLTMKNFIN